MKNRYVIKRLLRYVARYKLRMAALFAVGVAGVLFEVAKPLPVKIIIDNVLTGKPLPVFLQNLFYGANTLTDKNQLLFLCVILIAIIVVCSAVISFVTVSLTVKLAQRLVYDLSVDFYSKLQQLSLPFYLKNKTGDLLQRMSGDVFVVYFLVAQIIIPGLTSLLCLSAMFYVMAHIDLLLAVIALSVVPLLGLVLGLFMKPMNDTSIKQNKKLGELSAFVQQSLSSMKIIQAFARESFMNQKVKQHAHEYGQHFQTATEVSSGFNQVVVLITGLASAVLIGFGAYRGMHSNFSAGDLYIFIGYLAALYTPVNGLFTAIGTAVVIGARGKRVIEILDSDETVKESVDAKSLDQAEGSIEFENVEFGYEENHSSNNAVLKNISFKVPAGKIVAIVGATGAGKTSMISLLVRFYQPWKGRILIDGHDVNDIRLHSLRKNISLVMQEPFLFPMSIAENIAFGNPRASMGEIIEAAKNAQAHNFISKLPEAYNTVISESGASLSGGEKQRISIARAFLKKAPILVLDEPTSAVDAHTEAKIFEAINNFSKGKTVFLISHRLSTIKHADQIITLKGGFVVEQGTHKSLLEKGNVYADLYKYQHIS